MPSVEEVIFIASVCISVCQFVPAVSTVGHMNLKSGT